MFEYEKAKDMIGLTLNDIHDRNSEVTQITMREWIENRYTCDRSETVEFNRYGGKRYFLSSSVSTIENNCVVSTWFSQVDITELREAQQALLEAEQARSQQLEELNLELQQTVNSLQNRDRQLQQRDRIMAATTEASNVLLTGNNLDEAVNRALEIIGESIDTDRIAIVENFNNPEDSLHLYWKITYEWDSDYAVSQINHPEVSQGSYEGIEEWDELFRKGQTISCQLEELPIVRSGLVRMIELSEGMEVVAEAATGSEAVELFRQHQPDVALMDLRMPELNGVEAIVAIRQEFPDARIAILTTYDTDEDIFRGLQAGARGYLLKDSKIVRWQN